MYDKTVETKLATRVPSIDSKAESAKWARPVGAHSWQPRYLWRACVRAPGLSHGLEPNKLSTDPVIRNAASWFMTLQLLQFHVQSKIIFVEGLMLLKNDINLVQLCHSCLFCVAAKWDTLNALFVFVFVIVFILFSLSCCLCKMGHF